MKRYSKIERIYSRNVIEVERFLLLNHWNRCLKFAYGYIEIYSSFDTWRIYAENKQKNLMLYHKNKKPVEKIKSKIDGFHKQPHGCGFEEIMMVLKYIKGHDDYTIWKQTGDDDVEKYYKDDFLFLLMGIECK